MKNIRTHQPTLINAGTVITGWATATAGCVVSLENSFTLFDGSTAACIKSIGNGAGGLNRVNYSPAGDVDFSASRGIECDIYVTPDSFPDTKPNGVTVQIFLAQDSGFTNYFSAGQTLLKPGWNRIRVTRDAFLTANGGSTGGSPTWDNPFDTVRFNFGAITGKTVTVYISNLRHAGASRAQFPIVFDDGWLTVYTVAFPYMAARGLVGTVAVINSYVGTANYMTWAQIQELHDAGWAIVNHTLSHQQNVLNSASQAVCYAEINGMQEILKGRGYTRDEEHLCFCAPYGEWSDNYLAAAVQSGCTMFRTTLHTNSTLPTDPLSGDQQSSLFPVGIMGIINTWPVATILTNMRAHAMGGRTSCGILFHTIATPADTAVKTTIADFEAIISEAFNLSSVMDFPTLPQLVKLWGNVS